MENLCSLLFELSGEDRLRILHQLDKKAMNVTHLSKELDLTKQEVSRIGFRRLTFLLLFYVGLPTQPSNRILSHSST